MLDERVTNLSGASGAFHLGPSLRAGRATGSARAPSCASPAAPSSPAPSRGRTPTGWFPASAATGRWRGTGTVGVADLSRIPGPEAGSHDDVFLTDLDERLGRAGQPRPGAGVPARLGSRGVPVGHLVAAVRRCPRHAAARRLRARHRALDLRRQSRGRDGQRRSGGAARARPSSRPRSPPRSPAAEAAPAPASPPRTRHLAPASPAGRGPGSAPGTRRLPRHRARTPRRLPSPGCDTTALDITPARVKLNAIAF